MLIGYKRGQGSIILRVKLLNSSVATGAGLTGLTNASSGLIISTIADNEAAATVYTVAASNVETITTLGTFAAPTASKCRFREVDATNHPGVYEIQIADARYAVANAKSLLVSISGATNLAQCDVVVPLRDLDPYDAVRAGLTALPNAAANTAGGLASAVHRNGTLPAQTGANPAVGTVNLAASGIGATDKLLGQMLVVFSAAFTIRGVGIITAADNANDRVTLNGGTALTFTPAQNDTYAILGLPGLVGLTQTQIGIIRTGTAQAGAAGTITLDSGASASNDFYNNTYVQIIGGTGAGQARFITAYVGATKVATVNGNWVTNPDNTSVFQVWAFGALPGASAPTAAQVADAVWDEALADHTAAGSAGERAGRIPNAAAGGNGGLPTADANNAVKVQNGTGANQISLASGLVTVGTNNDKTGYALSSAGIQAIWDALTSALTTVGSIGKRIADFLTGDAFVRLGAPAGASVSADVAAVKAQTAAIEADTQDLQARTPAALVSGRMDASVGAMAANVMTAAALAADARAALNAMRKNVAYPIYLLYMRDSTTKAGATGKTVTVSISKDGGAFATATNAVSEIGNGWYVIASGFTQAEMNANMIAVKGTATGCDDWADRIVTQPT